MTQQVHPAASLSIPLHLPVPTSLASASEEDSSDWAKRWRLMDWAQKHHFLLEASRAAHCQGLGFLHVAAACCADDHSTRRAAHSAVVGFEDGMHSPRMAVRVAYRILHGLYCALECQVAAIVSQSQALDAVLAAVGDVTYEVHTSASVVEAQMYGVMVSHYHAQAVQIHSMSEVGDGTEVREKAVRKAYVVTHGRIRIRHGCDAVHASNDHPSEAVAGLHVEGVVRYDSR